jgi:hypothetical protein
MLSLDTIKAIEAEKKRNQRLAEIQRKQRAYQIRLLVREGYGVDDLMHDPKEGPSKPWKLGLSREAARAAVFGGGK